MKRAVLFFMLLLTFAATAQVPQFKWVKKIPFDIVGQATDSHDNVYIIGNFSDTLFFENQTFINGHTTDILVVKFDSSGNMLWNKQIKGSDSLDYIYGIDVDVNKNDDVIITATMLRTFIIIGNDTIFADSHGHNAFLAKFTSEGNLVWAEVSGYSETNCYHTYFSTIDNENNIIITGSLFDNGIFQDSTIISVSSYPLEVLAKYYPSGQVQWIRTWGYKNDIRIDHLAFDDSNNIILILSPDSLGYNVFKYSSGGELIWRKILHINSLYILTERMYYKCLATDSYDNFYIFSRFSDTLNISSQTFISHSYNSLILLKFDSTGELIWGTQIDAPYSIFPKNIRIKDDKILLTGDFKKKMYFMNDSLEYPTYIENNSMLKYNGFLAEYDLAGNPFWAKKFGGPNGCQSRFTSSDESIYIYGSAGDSAYFDNFILTDTTFIGYSGGFLARLHYDEFNMDSVADVAFAYPNPFENNVNIYLNSAYSEAELEIYNIQGSLIKRYSLKNPLNTIYLGQLSGGIYIFKVITDDAIYSSKLVKGTRQD